MPQCFNKLRPGEGETAGGEQEQEEGSRWEKGFMVERIRARQSATSLLGAQARAGVWPAGGGGERAGEVNRSIDGVKTGPHQEFLFIVQRAKLAKTGVCAAERRLAFLIHSQHSGSSTQQRLHHRGQAVSRRQVKGPAGGETRGESPSGQRWNCCWKM